MSNLQFYHCPIKGCQHHSTGLLPFSIVSRDHLCHHLSTCHQNQLYTADPSLCLSYNIHPCPSCPNSIYKSSKGLTDHFHKCHQTRRTSTNSQLCHRFFTTKHPTPHRSEWTTGLQFIHDTITPRPAECRSGIRDLAKPKQFQQFLRFFIDIIRACNAASASFKSSEHDRLPDWEQQDYPFYWLLFHAELLVFCPSSDPQESISHCISRRLELLYAGRIEELWKETLAVSSRTPGSKPPKPTNAVTVNKAAQAAADVDNYRTAYARATSTTPIATISHASLSNNVKKLYPNKLPPPPGKPPSARTTTNQPSPTSQYLPLPGDIIHTIQHAPRGKANGILMDSMDVYIAIAKLRDNEAHQQLTDLFTRLYNGCIHPLIVPFFTSTYLFCLEKDPDDPTKLRPIGVPSAPRRLLASHVAKASREKFARHLLPYNYAIGVPDGMDFVIKATQLQVDRFITQPQAQGLSPTRCLLSLDLKNMFNELSREEIFDIIAADFPELLPLAHMLYNDPGEVWIRLDDGTWYRILNEEGTNQGCPLSSTFAALVLHAVLHPITQLLHQRAADRLAAGDPGDDGRGGVSNPLAYVDDKNTVLYLPDVIFFLDELQQRSPRRGLWIQPLKTRILTSTNGTSAIPAIRQRFGDKIASEIVQAISKYSTKAAPTPSNPLATTPFEVTTGLRVLGQPVGSKDFARSFFSTAIDKVESQVAQLFNSLSDKPTLLRLFSQCAMHKTPHLLGAEVLYFMDDIAPSSWANWEGPLASRIHRMAHDFLARLTNTPSIPPSSMLIAYISIAHGGLGLMDPHSRAIPDFVVTMSTAIRAATSGFYMGKNIPPVMLPDSIADHFNPITNSLSPILHHYHRFLPQLAARATASGVPDPISHFVFHTSTKSARDRIRQEASHLRFASLSESASPELQRDMSEVLISSTSYPLIAMPRTTKAHRQPNDLFLISLKRKLYLDLYPTSNLPTCACGTTIDPKGSHVFNCKEISKWGCHNRIRDGLKPILCHLLKTAHIISPTAKLHTEPHGIIPSIPNCRPFDISFRPDNSLCSHDQAMCPLAEVGFDVTITSTKGHLPPSQATASAIQSAIAAGKHLSEKEKRKLTRKGMVDSQHNYVTGNKIIEQLLINDMALIPIAVSPYGRWGNMFFTFLFGPSPTLRPLNFKSNESNAARMYHLATSSPTPIGLIPNATAAWKANKPPSQHFFGHSYTSSTPKEYFLQKAGLVISNAPAIHLQDAKQGTLHRKTPTPLIPPPPGFPPLDSIIAHHHPPSPVQAGASHASYPHPCAPPDSQSDNVSLPESLCIELGSL